MICRFRALIVMTSRIVASETTKTAGTRTGIDRLGSGDVFAFTGGLAGTDSARATRADVGAATGLDGEAGTAAAVGGPGARNALFDGALIGLLKAGSLRTQPLVSASTNAAP